MVKEAIATGATTEEAYEKACAMLGVDPADAEFEVLETEEKKRFGLFGGSISIGKYLNNEGENAVA